MQALEKKSKNEFEALWAKYVAIMSENSITRPC